MLIVFVVALLRSHAEILRRIGALERGQRIPRGPTAPTHRGDLAHDIAGKTLADDAVKIALGAGAGSTLLAFLSSGCSACGAFWSALGAGSVAPAGARVIVVTKSVEVESLTRLQELAPSAYELVMSTDAWLRYEVPATPHFVLVDADGTVAGRGSAATWEQLMALVEQSTADAAAPRLAHTSSERATRAEQALARAGITPDHPSLYPSRATTLPGEDGPA